MVILGGGGKIRHMYDDIISIENLCDAWSEFICDKRNKKDVAEFSLNLSNNIFNLHIDLKNKTYKHGQYIAFSISDPKPRNIHKATVRDRLLHHAIYRILYPVFDGRFIYDSYSCRYSKGTHKAIEKFNQFKFKVSKSNSRTCWVLKCDIRKFFASIDQAILIEIVKKHVKDIDTILLIKNVVESFQSTGIGKGLPLGNLTSQLLVNVYMNEFDQFIKYELKEKYYIRYADDFVIMSENKNKLIEILPKISEFLNNSLKLNLHPNKVFIQTVSSGVDFLGWVNFYHHRVLRTSTKRRMFKNIMVKRGKKATIQSYLGLLKHGDTYLLQNRVKNLAS